MEFLNDVSQRAIQNIKDDNSIIKIYHQDKEFI